MHKVASSIVAASIAATFALAVAQGETPAAPDLTAASNQAPATPTKAKEIDPVLSSMPIFTERPASTMPKDVVSLVGSAEKFGRNAELARSIDTVTGQGWVIPGNGSVCIAMPDPAGGWATSCQRSEITATTGVAVGLREGDAHGRPVGPYIVAAVLPKGVESAAGLKADKYGVVTGETNSLPRASQ